MCADYSHYSLTDWEWVVIWAVGSFAIYWVANVWFLSHCIYDFYLYLGHWSKPYLGEKVPISLIYADAAYS